MTWHDITIPGIPLVLFVTALLIAVGHGRTGRRCNWMTFFAKLGIPLAGAFIALTLLAAWLNWRQIDRWQQSMLAGASVVSESREHDRSIVEVVYPNGATGKMIRYDFDPPIADNIQWGVVFAIVATALALFARSFIGGWVRAQRKRKNQCVACAYSLVGSSGRTCPECGEEIA